MSQTRASPQSTEDLHAERHQVDHFVVVGKIAEFTRYPPAVRLLIVVGHQEDLQRRENFSNATSTHAGHMGPQGPKHRTLGHVDPWAAGCVACPMKVFKVFWC